MNSWDRLKIIDKVIRAADAHGSSNPQQQKQLIFSCSNASEREVFFGLFSFFYDETLQENKFERQQLAGTILLSVAPNSALKLDGSVFAAATIWDLSIEELPWYWCKIFGKLKVVKFLSELLIDCEDTKLRRCIETMLYWSKGYRQNSS